MQSAVLPQHTFWSHRQTDRPTDRWDRRQDYTISTYACYIDRQQRVVAYRNLECGLFLG